MLPSHHAVCAHVQVTNDANFECVVQRRHFAVDVEFGRHRRQFIADDVALGHQHDLLGAVSRAQLDRRRRHARVDVDGA